jgi:hypothetical protein
VPDLRYRDERGFEGGDGAGVLAVHRDTDEGFEAEADRGRVEDGAVAGRADLGPALTVAHPAKFPAWPGRWGPLARACSSACAIFSSERQMTARMRAEPAKASQNGAVMPHAEATSPPSTDPITMPPTTPVR